jgi:hypothetical protein
VVVSKTSITLNLTRFFLRSTLKSGQEEQRADEWVMDADEVRKQRMAALAEKRERLEKLRKERESRTARQAEPEPSMAQKEKVSKNRAEVKQTHKPTNPQIWCQLYTQPPLQFDRKYGMLLTRISLSPPPLSLCLGGRPCELSFEW